MGNAGYRRNALWWYALYSAVNVAVSAVLGIVVLAGVDVDCVGAANRGACDLLQSVTGILLLCVQRAFARGVCCAARELVRGGARARRTHNM